MAENERLYTIPQGKLRNLVDEDAQDADEDRAEDRNQNGADGPGLQAGLDVHSTEVGHDMEIAVVQEGRAHGGQADGQTCQIGVDPQRRQHRSDDGGAGDHGRGAGTLREAHDGADQEGDQNARDAQSHDARRPSYRLHRWP